MQYEYFFEENISPKGFEYANPFNTVLLFPASVVKKNLFNIGRFKYPETTIIIEVNETSKVTRLISNNELQKLGDALDENLATISQYYIRDNRIFELYLLLKYLMFLKISGEDSVNRADLEKNKLTLLDTPNNRNWRNAFISLSSLGFIDSSNLPTPSGVKMSACSYEDFLLMIYKSYIAPYINELMEYFSEQQLNLTKNNQEIAADIKIKYTDKDVLFLTQSKGRYLSSWLNILRDDFGCIDFQSKSSDRKLKYDISQLNDDAILKKIKEHTKANQYLSKFKELIKK